MPLKKLGQPHPDSYFDVLSNNSADQYGGGIRFDADSDQNTLTILNSLVQKTIF